MVKLTYLEVNTLCMNIATVADYLNWNISDMYGGHNSKYGSDDKGDFVVYFMESFSMKMGLDFDYILQYARKHNLRVPIWSTPSEALQQLLGEMYEDNNYTR